MDRVRRTPGKDSRGAHPTLCSACALIQPYTRQRERAKAALDYCAFAGVDPLRWAQERDKAVRAEMGGL